MRSTAMPRAERQARWASRTPAAHLLARAGLIARGIIYILIGWVAILVATGHGSHEADQAGALQLLAGKPYGVVSLWLLAIGFVGYALWRLSEAAFGVTGDQNGAGPRLKSLGRAVVYAGFAYLTVRVITGAQGSQARQQQDATAKVMAHPGGRWLVGAVGVVFGLAGVLVIDAAITHNPAKSGGIDKALLTLRDQPFGPALLVAAALGLVIFGIYGLCEARWRKV